MIVSRPWRIDEDSDKRIVVKDDRGFVVHECEYECLPGFSSAATPEQMVQQERANCYAMVEGVNLDTRSSEQQR